MGDLARGKYIADCCLCKISADRSLQEYNTVIAKDASPALEVHGVEKGTTRATDLRQHDAALGVVIENRVLTAPGTREKRHIGEILLKYR